MPKMQYFTMDEFRRLLQEVPNPRQRLMLKVGFHHGLRVSELLGLEARHIRDGFVSVKRLKKSEPTIQPFQLEQKKTWLDEDRELRELAVSLRPTERLFPMTRFGVDKLIKRAGRRASIPYQKLHAHALKHTVAHYLIDDSGIKNVRQWLGHKSMASTGAYLRVSDESASLAVAEAKRAIDAREDLSSPL